MDIIKNINQVESGMNKFTVTKTLAIIVMITGILVTLGWIFGIDSLKSIFPNYPTMKFSTSVSFVFSGIGLYFISRHMEGKGAFAQILLPASGLVIFLFMATILISNITSIHTGIEDIFVKETGNPVQTTVPGRPSVGTMASFILMIPYGIFSLSNSDKLRKTSVWFGYAIAGIGATSLVGFAINLPQLYYASQGVSSAMALHTSILFIMIGTGIILLQPYRSVVQTGYLKRRVKAFSYFLIATMIPIIFISGLSYNIVKDPTTSLESFGASILIMGVLSMLAVGFFSFMITGSMMRSILNLKDVTSKISKGDLNLQADESSTDEMRDLAKSFNQMNRSIKSMHEEKIQSEKLALVGQLTSRLTHDLRNPLFVIKNEISLLKMREKNMDDQKMRSFTRLDNTIQRIDAQIADTLDFVRHSSLKLGEYSLLSILKNSIENMVIPDTVKIELPENDARIICDEIRISIVFSNIIANAIQAINDNGTIKIRIKDDMNKAMIEFEDSGQGISEEILPKIFTPLFTTKSKGTGLGLATCKSVIEQHHGTISVNSIPTIFTISFSKNKLAL